MFVKKSRVRVSSILSILGLAIVPACGFGGGGGGGGTAGAGGEAASLAPKTSFTDDDIRHFLMRTHFGINQAEFDAAKNQGLSAYIDGTLNWGALDSTTHESLAAQRLINSTDPAGFQGMYPNGVQLVRWWLHMMIENPNPVQESIALFWHDHFATSSAVLGSDTSRYMKEMINLFRNPDRGLGSFRDLVVDVSRNGAMLVWLNGYQNHKNQPNENFARELWELFTLGVENSGLDDGYTQIDIEQASKALTGYKIVFNSTTNLSTFEFDPTRHDPTAKLPLGGVIPGQNTHDDYAELVDLTLERREQKVARFIAKKVLQWFCFEVPSTAAINNLAKSFIDHNWNIKEGIFRPLFKSKMFYSATAKTGMVRNPVDASIGFIRTTGLKANLSVIDTTSNNFLDNIYTSLSSMDMLPTQPPDVNGFNMNQQWLGAQQMIFQSNFLRYALVFQSAAARLPILQAMLPAGGGPGSPPTPQEALVKFENIFHLDLSDEEITRYVTYMNTRRLTDGTIVDQLVTLTNSADIELKVKGLLYLLGQHPSFLVK